MWKIVGVGILPMCLILPPFPLMYPEGEDDRTVCKEIRHNSTGCLKMKGQCEKCQEILSVGESRNQSIIWHYDPDLTVAPQ